MSGVRPRHVIATVLCAAVVSIWVAPTSINFDPWGWLVWGREITQGALDTTGGPSWKPLPVLVTTPLSWFGERAPALWMLLARAGGMLMAVIVAVLAARVAGVVASTPDAETDDSAHRRVVVVAAVAAAAFLILTPDPEPRWIRTVLEGHAAPLTAGLTTWAIERHLAGHRRMAWAALVAASLLRPEVWPFLLVYGGWLVWSTRRNPYVNSCLARIDMPRAAVVVASGIGVAVAWFGGDYWGSGSFWHGADAAQVGPDSVGDRWSLVVDVTTEMAPAVVWLLAAVAIGVGVRRLRQGSAGRSDRAVVAIAGLATAWVGIVAVLALTLGYAAISRFLLPPAALLCVLAGIGLAALVGAAITSRGLRTALVLAVVAAGVLAIPRVTGLSTVWDEIIARGDRAEDLDRAVDAAIDAVGRDALLACGEPIITEPGLRAHLAWSLEVPMHATGSRTPPVAGSVLFVGRDVSSPLVAPTLSVVPIVETGHWRVMAVDCAITQP